MKLYNSIKRAKEEFVPIDSDEIKMYVCGPTVYNYIHVGNARPLVVFDTLRRYLNYKGQKVNYVVNFTDIDDKLINKAKEENTTVSELAERYIEEYLKDSRALNVNEEDTKHPKATEHIDDIVEYVKALIEKGYAYESHGDVYFEVAKVEDYGKLSKKKLEDLISGARVSVSDIKKSPADFALWKKAKVGEPAWESPWGLGRPGWHIECSVMSQKYLGETMDIHAGGEDLQFPHHENEIAQSESLTGKPFANYWLHNGMINVNNEKMSKSKGNFFTVREISEEFHLEILRFFLLTAHYRKPINFSRDNMEQAKRGLERIYKSKERLEELLESAKGSEISEKDAEALAEVEKYRVEFEQSMEDDINTADAISAIFEMVKVINTSLDENSSRKALEEVKSTLCELGEVIGIFHMEKESLEGEIEKLIEQRNKARAEKDFATADRIRDELLNDGIVLEDTPHGVKWRRV